MMTNNLIKNEQILKQSSLDENVRYYKTKGFDFKNYNKITVEEIRIIDNENNNKVDKKILDKITNYFHSNLETKLNSVIKTNQKENELVLKIAIANIETAYEELAFYQYLPYGLAFTAIKRGIGYEKRDLNIQLILKLIDKKSKKSQVLLVDNGLVKNIQSQDELSFVNTKPLLDAWIAKYTKRVKELNQGKYKEK